jgi:hypothetical protein
VTFSTIVCLKVVGPLVVVVTSIIPLVPNYPQLHSTLGFTVGVVGVTALQKCYLLKHHLRINDTLLFVLLVIKPVLGVFKGVT